MLFCNRCQESGPDKTARLGFFPLHQYNGREVSTINIFSLSRAEPIFNQFVLCRALIPLSLKYIILNSETYIKNFMTGWADKKPFGNTALLFEHGVKTIFVSTGRTNFKGVFHLDILNFIIQMSYLLLLEESCFDPSPVQRHMENNTNEKEYSGPLVHGFKCHLRQRFMENPC